MSQVEYDKTNLSYRNFWVHCVIANQLASMFYHFATGKNFVLMKC